MHGSTLNRVNIQVLKDDWVEEVRLKGASEQR